MKLSVASTLSLALGASALYPNPAQQILGASNEEVPAFLTEAIEQAKAALGGFEIPLDAASVWVEVAKLFPGDTVAALQSLASPKTKAKEKTRRRPDSEWDHIVEGDQMMSAMSGKIDGHEKLKGTRLRVKKPNGLGIDEDVKQYSGYLDVDDDDKHFFFCKLIALLPRWLDRR